jgi:hypothetical protein
MGGFVEFPHSGSILLGCNLDHSNDLPLDYYTREQPTIWMLHLDQLPSFQGHVVRALHLGPPPLVQGVMP